jgi:hypothetical protein
MPVVTLLIVTASCADETSIVLSPTERQQAHGAKVHALCDLAKSMFTEEEAITPFLLTFQRQAN